MQQWRIRIEHFLGIKAGMAGDGLFDIQPVTEAIVNTAKKHQKARSANQQGGIIDRDMPIDASNVMLVHRGTPTRVGYRIDANGKKVRVAKRTGEVIG